MEDLYRTEQLEEMKARELRMFGWTVPRRVAYPVFVLPVWWSPVSGTTNQPSTDAYPVPIYQLINEARRDPRPKGSAWNPSSRVPGNRPCLDGQLIVEPEASNVVTIRAETYQESRSRYETV